ncbi:MAG: hydrolase [Gammaproteobacteria bacterium]|nr:hydrolase [Gammaproteobacteria bacterium]
MHIASPFKPAWWLPSPHLQTLWPVLFRRRKSPELVNERLELSDGDFVDLCWSKKSDRPVVLLLHGLEGSVQSHYVGNLMLSLERAGFSPVFMHFRGCSGEPNRLPRSYHSGDTGDLAEVVAHINQQSKQAVYAAIGFSLGGNVLLKWLGQSGAANPLQYGVAVSVPFMLADAATRLEGGVSHLYERHLMRSLKRSYQTKFERMASPLDVDIDTMKGFWDFDDQVTAPLHGFDGVDHYYRESSCRQYLSGINVPTRIIHALDDPFMFPRSIPDIDEISKSVELLLAEKGGHVGFVSGKYPWKPEYWYEQRIIEFLS